MIQSVVFTKCFISLALFLDANEASTNLTTAVAHVGFSVLQLESIFLNV